MRKDHGQLLLLMARRRARLREKNVEMTWRDLRGSLENREKLRPGRGEPRDGPSWVSHQLCGPG